MFLLVLALIAQTLGPTPVIVLDSVSGYTVNAWQPDAQLVTPDGTYSILQFGKECAYLAGNDQDVSVIWGGIVHQTDGEENMGAVLLTGDGQQCSVLTRGLDA